jgi:hypothetical protein
LKKDATLQRKVRDRPALGSRRQDAETRTVWCGEAKVPEKERPTEVPRARLGVSREKAEEWRPLEIIEA